MFVTSATNAVSSAKQQRRVAELLARRAVATSCRSRPWCRAAGHWGATTQAAGLALDELDEVGVQALSVGDEQAVRGVLVQLELAVRDRPAVLRAETWKGIIASLSPWTIRAGTLTTARSSAGLSGS
jgi:hypothetical protein